MTKTNVLQWSYIRRYAYLIYLCVLLSIRCVFTRVVRKILVSVWTRPDSALHTKIKVTWRWSGFYSLIHPTGKLLSWLIGNEMDTHLQRLEDGSAVGGQLGVGGLAEELGEGSDGVQFVCWNLERKKKHTHKKKRGIKQTSKTTTVPPSVCFLFPPHLRELSVSKPLQPPHAVAGLPLAGGAPRHHDAGPPGEALDFPPHQLADAETLVVLEVRRQREWGEGHGRVLHPSLPTKITRLTFSDVQKKCRGGAKIWLDVRDWGWRSRSSVWFDIFLSLKLQVLRTEERKLDTLAEMSSRLADEKKGSNISGSTKTPETTEADERLDKNKSAIISVSCKSWKPPYSSYSNKREEETEEKKRWKMKNNSLAILVLRCQKPFWCWRKTS